MKLFKPTEDEKFYIPIYKWKRILLASSILIISLYIVAMICSLCGLDYFILNYQNPQMDKIYIFLREHYLYSSVEWLFSTIEFFIISTFILKRFPKWYYVLAYYVPVVVFSFITPLPSFVYIIYSFLFYFILPLFQLESPKLKDYLMYAIRICISAGITFLFQLMIFIIKTGSFTTTQQTFTLAGFIIYSLEYDIALIVVLLTISLFLDTKKGGNNLCTTSQVPGGSSQISKKQLQTLKWKTLSKKVKHRLIWLYVKLWVTQLGGFLLVMILPFVFGKVLEFLIMYLCFCIARYIIGFKYSLHYKRESICISVGVIVFGLLTLIVPSFQVDLVLSILFGISLALLLYLSYRLKSADLFLKRIGKDRFAELYVILNGNLDNDYIKKMSNHYNLNELETNILVDYMNGEKLSYISVKYHYSTIYINKVLDKIIDKMYNLQ